MHGKVATTISGDIYFEAVAEAWLLFLCSFCPELWGSGRFMFLRDERFGRRIEDNSSRWALGGAAKAGNNDGNQATKWLDVLVVSGIRVERYAHNEKVSLANQEI